MATTLVTITGNVTDLISGDFDARRTKVYLKHNTSFVVDPDAGVVRLGSATLSINTDGTFTLPDVIASADTVENLQSTIYVDYEDRASRKRQTQSFGPYDLSGETGTVDLTELEEVQHLDPSYVSVTMTEMQGLLDQAAEYLAEQIDLSNISTPDALVATLVENTGGAGPLTSAALTASYVGAVVMAGEGIDPTGATDSTAAIQAKINGAAMFGAKRLHFPDGIFKVDGTLLSTDDDVEITFADGWLKPTTGVGITVQGARPTLHRPKIRIEGGTPTAGIRIDSATRCTINAPVVWAFADIVGTVDGIVVDDNAYWCEIVRPRFRKNSGVLTGSFRRLVAVTNISNACRIWGGDFSHATTGVYASDSNNVIVIGGAFEGVTDGIEVAGTAGCPGLRVLGTRHEDGTSCVKITTTATSINAPMEFELTRVSSVTNLVADPGNKGGYVLRSGGVAKVVPGIALGDATNTHHTLQAGDAQSEAMWTLLSRPLGGGTRMAEWDRQGNLVFSSPSASWPSQGDAVGVLRHHLGNTYLHAVNPASSAGRVILGVGNGSGANKDVIGVGTNYLRPEADNSYNLGQTAMRFAQAFVVGGTIKALTTLTGSTAIGANHYRVIANGNSITITLPDPTGGVGVAGREYVVKNIHSTALTVASAGTSKTIDGAASDSLAQWESATYVSDGTQWFVV